MKGDLKVEMKKKMFDQLVKYWEEGYSGVRETWDLVQTRLDCCGVDTWTDWLNNSSVPDSCCLTGDKSGCGQQATEDTVHTTGCFQAFKLKFLHNLDNVGSKRLY